MLTGLAEQYCSEFLSILRITANSYICIAEHILQNSTAEYADSEFRLRIQVFAAVFTLVRGRGFGIIPWHYLQNSRQRIPSANPGVFTLVVFAAVFALVFALVSICISSICISISSSIYVSPWQFLVEPRLGVCLGVRRGHICIYMYTCIYIYIYVYIYIYIYIHA